jgi:hypothetical protein
MKIERRTKLCEHKQIEIMSEKMQQVSVLSAYSFRGWWYEKHYRPLTANW